MELEEKKFIIIKDKNGKETKMPFDFETNILEEGDYIFKDKDGKWYLHKENNNYQMILLKKDLDKLENY